MYSFTSQQNEQATEKIGNLIDAILDMENIGDLSDQETDECMILLRKICHITGAEVDFDDLNDEYIW